MFYLNFLFLFFKNSIKIVIEQNVIENSIENYLRLNKELPFVPFYLFIRYFYKYKRPMWELTKNRRMVGITIRAKEKNTWYYVSFILSRIFKIKGMFLIYIFAILCNKYNYMDGWMLKPSIQLRKGRKRVSLKYNFSSNRVKKIYFPVPVFSLSVFKRTGPFINQPSPLFFLSLRKKRVLFKKYPLAIYFILLKTSNLISLFNKVSIQKLNINFLRKNKIFNKSRYSRNRQYYRTGIYWCLYINIIAMFGFYFWFYKLTFNFGYLWWLFYCFFMSFFFSKFIKYNIFFLYFYDIFLDFSKIVKLFYGLFLSFSKYFKKIIFYTNLL